MSQNTFHWPKQSRGRWSLGQVALEFLLGPLCFMVHGQPASLTGAPRKLIPSRQLTFATRYVHGCSNPQGPSSPSLPLGTYFEISLLLRAVPGDVIVLL